MQVEIERAFTSKRFSKQLWNSLVISFVAYLMSDLNYFIAPFLVF